MKYSEDEQNFAAGWTGRRIRAFLVVSYVIVILTHVCSLAVVPMLVVAPVDRILSWYHACLLALATVGACSRRWPKLHLGMMCWVLALSATYYIGLLYFAVHVYNSERNILLASAGSIVYSVFGILTYPGRLSHLLMLTPILAASAVVAMHGTPGGGAWIVIYLVAISLTFALRSTVAYVGRHAAIQEYRFRLFVAPAHIARQATGGAEELAKLFKPRETYSVCLSSDWRGYQELSAHWSPSVLASTIGDYYDMCQELLRRHVPAGNYFADWIADELFIVFYPVETAKDEGLVDVALAFAHDLILAKHAFAEARQLPLAIDIGVSCGTALLGLMGPSDHKKATALGQVPGRSRRLQSSGKLLRQQLGQRDRIIFGEEVQRGRHEKIPVNVFTIVAGKRIRDTLDRQIYYLEPSSSGPELIKSA